MARAQDRHAAGVGTQRAVGKRDAAEPPSAVRVQAHGDHDEIGGDRPARLEMGSPAGAAA